jgi:hypothetical protein
MGHQGSRTGVQCTMDETRSITHRRGPGAETPGFDGLSLEEPIDFLPEQRAYFRESIGSHQMPPFVSSLP